MRLGGRSRLSAKSPTIGISAVTAAALATLAQTPRTKEAIKINIYGSGAASTAVSVSVPRGFGVFGPVDQGPKQCKQAFQANSTPDMPGVTVILGSLLAGLAAWVIYHRAQRTLRYDVHKIPGPKQLPLLGNVGSIIGSSYVHRVADLEKHALTTLSSSRMRKFMKRGCSFLQILAQWTSKYGSIFKWKLVGINILVITDPEEVNKLCSREVNLPKASAFYKGLNSVSFLTCCLSCLSHATILLQMCTLHLLQLLPQVNYCSAD